MFSKNPLLIKLIHFFITKWNYHLIITQNDDDNYFLESVDNKKAQVIWLSSKKFLNNDQIKHNLVKLRNISNNIGKETWHFKSIFLIIFTEKYKNDFDNKLQNMNIYFTQNQDSFGELNTLFPGIEKIILKTKKKNNQNDIANYLLKIKQYQKIKFNNIFKFKNFSVIYLIVSMVIILNLFIFIYLRWFGIFKDYSLNQIVTVFGSSSHAMTVINGQWWRPLVSNFFIPSVINLLISIYIFKTIGQMMENIFGSIKILITIILGSFLANTFLTMFLPGITIFGFDAVLATLFGVVIYYGNKNRVEFFKIAYPRIRQSYIFMVLTFIFSGVYGMIFIIFGLVFGYIIISFLENYQKIFNFETVISSVTLVASIFLIFLAKNYLPIKYSIIDKIDNNLFDGYEVINKNPIEYKKNICLYYNQDFKNCHLLQGIDEGMEI